MANNHRSTRVNSVLVASIPINRKVKRYWIAKFERICDNCGPDEAVRKFKNLRVKVLAYLSDPNRKANLNGYLTSTGFRTNGMLRKLFEQADCQPHYILSFLKLYSAEQKSSQTADDAAIATHERLEHVCANEAIPGFLSDWFEQLFSPHWQGYQNARRNPRHRFHRYATFHSYEEWHNYWLKWYRLLRRGWQSRASRDYKPVFPEIYKDFKEVADIPSSRSYDRDFVELTAMHYLTAGLSPLSSEQLRFVDGFLDDDVRLELETNPGACNTGMPELGIEGSLLGFAVGQVQHIHKKGGGTELRDIAVPNRFIQGALVPGAARLYNLVRCLPKDATFQQSKFDTYITGRVSNPNLYQGSVDLSKATDNLPSSWGEFIVDQLENNFWLKSEWIDFQDYFSQFDGESKEVDPWRNPDLRFGNSTQVVNYRREVPLSWQEESYSLDLFKTVSRAKWEDGVLYQQWKVGQPLGSLPSFAMLAITHNLLVESLALSQGLGHSPYVILGDDIVICNKKLRKRYIRELSSRAIPLSLHKSFEGRLSEFAGKTYVHKCVPFYCSDHNPITWESLFDWQRSTGIRISWEYLPRPIRRKVEGVTRDVLTENGLTPSRKSAIELARSSYNLVLSCEVWGAGSRLYDICHSEEQSEWMSGYFEYRETSDKIIPEAVKHSGISLLAGRYPVTLMGSRLADKNGHFQRFHPVKLPDWYKEKFRPCATSSAISAAVQAIVHSKVH